MSELTSDQLANMCLEHKDYKTAIIYYNSSIIEGGGIPHPSHLNYHNYWNIAVCYSELKQYDNAIAYFEKASIFYIEPKDKISCNVSIGRCYYSLGDYYSASYYYKLAENISINISLDIINMYPNFYWNLGMY